jgi:putative methyltransferase (TIGR04325 family)
LTLRRVVIEALATEPCRTLLKGIARVPGGRTALNAASNPYGWYATVEQAWAAARKAVPVGHGHPSQIEFHMSLSESLRPSDYAAVYWISKIHPRDPKIFDFGGNAGNLYYSYSTRLLTLGSLEWVVFDVPAVIACGQKIAEERNTRGLQFADSVDAFKSEQILLVSGAFHYWEHDVRAFLRQFRELPEHVLINRSPIHETAPSFITVQRTEDCAFPCRVWNRDELIAAFAAGGYKLLDHWRAMELSLKLPLFPNLSVPWYSGFYFSRGT